MTKKKKTIWILGFGTRGELQPLVGLACALRRRFDDVTIMSNSNHEAFVTNFGIPFKAVSFDFSVTTEKPEFKSAMANNELAKTLAVMNRELEEKQGPFIASFDKMLAAAEDSPNKPDLILYTLGLFQLAWLAAVKYGVPIMPADFQPRPYRTALAPPVGLPSLPLGLNVLYSKLFSRLFWHAIVRKQGPLVAKHNVGNIDPIALVGYKNWEVEFTGRAPHPYLCGCSSLINELYPSSGKGIVPENFHITGPWVISAKDQMGNAKTKETSSVFGGPDALATLETFLNAEQQPPVYIGWGSMLCRSPEYMVRIAVGSLIQSNLRGVILGGWAGLSQKTLEKALAESKEGDDWGLGSTTTNTTDSVLEYAKENILFLEQAPHEWLFPRVSAIVHHGGAGTTAASLRSGIPTIVTPLGGDQPMHGKWVQSLGAGLCTKGLDKVTIQELGRALLQVTQDDTIRERAKEVGTKMNQEDGNATAVEIVSAHLDKLEQKGDFNNSLGIQLKQQSCVRF